MSQKELNNFTGFVAYYRDGNRVLEKNNYFSNKAKTKKATNWHEIDKDKIQTLELFWKGESKIKLDKKDYPHITPQDWYFSHYGCMDMSTHQTKVVSRNIGFIKDNVITLYCVLEETGVVKVEHKPRP